ncbi:hypothetical protein SY85_12000 [Flavisolibacter tropicus]|uniref:Uncharacterized protein n=1 Tax=Flavisolibacter tropicus TaxID=1492898 RepID=A0A172TVV7_9BACT|nr:hypothetical protein SY85_12000 [Flavisolibacter tropicus]
MCFLVKNVGKGTKKQRRARLTGFTQSAENAGCAFGAEREEPQGHGGREGHGGNCLNRDLGRFRD